MEKDEILLEQPLSRHDILEIEKEKNKASHLQPWQFKKGQSGNPKGRVPGKSLKERAKAMLNAMTEEEEQEFFAGIDKRTIWEMAEGKPDAKLQGDSDNPITLILKDINGNSIAQKLRAEDLSNGIPSSSSEI